MGIREPSMKKTGRPVVSKAQSGERGKTEGAATGITGKAAAKTTTTAPLSKVHFYPSTHLVTKPSRLLSNSKLYTMAYFANTHLYMFIMVPNNPMLLFCLLTGLVSIKIIVFM